MGIVVLPSNWPLRSCSFFTNCLSDSANEYQNVVNYISSDGLHDNVTIRNSMSVLEDFFVSCSIGINSVLIFKNYIGTLIKLFYLKNTLSDEIGSIFHGINSLGNFDLFLNNFSIRDSYVFKVLLQYGMFLQQSNLLMNEIIGVYENKTSPYIQSLLNKLTVNDPISDIMNIINSFQFDGSIFVNESSLSEGENGIQYLLNKLSVNDPISGIIDIINSFQLNGSICANSFEISNGHQKIQSLLNKLTVNDPISDIMNIINSFQFDGSIFVNESSLSEGRQKIQSLLTKLVANDPISDVTKIVNSLQLNGSIFTNEFELSDGKNGFQFIYEQISNMLNNYQSILVDISDVSGLFNISKIYSSIIDPAVTYSSIQYRIYLDGVDISRIVNSNITIERSQGNIHNSISFSSISQELYDKANPSDLFGEIRIEVHVGSSVFYFLLEERSHSSDGSVSYWGRDATARDNSPYSDTVSVSLSEWISAKELCESLTNYSVVDWNIIDWMLPNTFETSGSPIDVISEVVSELGAIVRAKEDGSLQIRYVNPIRPADLPVSDSVHTYCSTDVFNVNYSEKFGNGYNTVTVTADTNDKTAPILEVEDSINDSRIIGEDTYIRAYYYEDILNQPAVLNQDITDGLISLIGKFTDEITEIIQFQHGCGTSSYPLKSIKEITWLGRSDNIMTWNEYSTDVTLSSDTTCLAEITYYSEYYRYSATGHNVKELMAVFEIESSFFSSVKVITSGEEKSGEEITTQLLTDQAALVKRGEIWIDQNKYDEETISFESPYLDVICDGDIIWLEADRIIPGNYQVYDSSLTINGPKVVNTFSVKRWKI